MSGRYTLTPRARRDLDEIWISSVRTGGPTQAETSVRRLDGAFRDLAGGFKVGRNADDLRQGYLLHSVGSHIVYYRRPDDLHIEIVRVLHGRMDPGRPL
ncbi:type II toxin-antitoxin system RelE/ParE family toxin [Methylobacterium aerolatum]|uniref:type II toxin-antitoxin system RelE/ParE family toxin n=1 Tax=Methylobacterium aerolatum TaxID=418708 RepID=UPI003520C83A